MLYNIMDHTMKRKILSANFNHHTNSRHPDRIMEEHDLIYIREGCWNISQDGIDYHVQKGDVILLQGLHHHYGTDACTSDVKTCYVHFSRHPRDHVSDTPAETEDSLVFPVVVHKQNNAMVEQYFKRLIFSYWSDEIYEKKKAEAYLDLLLCELCDNSREMGSSAMVDDIQLQIKNTPERFISNEEFARRYYCSVRTLTDRFKKSTGVSLHAWQIKMKCQMADELMQHDPSLTLKEVAKIYGFYDEYHFGKCYKKVFGCSPKRLK